MRRALVPMLLVAALAACGKDAPAPAPAPTPVATPAPVAPAPAKPAEPASPLVAASPDQLTTAQIEELEKLATSSLECSSKWMRDTGAREVTIGPFFVEAGAGPELEAVATRIAADKLAELERIGKPQTEAERAARHYVAISLLRNPNRPAHESLVARAWSAYFANLGAQGRCPVHADVLRLIDKQP